MAHAMKCWTWSGEKLVQIPFPMRLTEQFWKIHQPQLCNMFVKIYGLSLSTKCNGGVIQEVNNFSIVLGESPIAKPVVNWNKLGQGLSQSRQMWASWNEAAQTSEELKIKYCWLSELPICLVAITAAPILMLFPLPFPYHVDNSEGIPLLDEARRQGKLVYKVKGSHRCIYNFSAVTITTCQNPGAKTSIGNVWNICMDD